MGVAVTDPNLWCLAVDVVEGARDDGLPIPELGTEQYQVEVAEVVLRLVQRLGLEVDARGQVKDPRRRPHELW